MDIIVTKDHLQMSGIEPEKIRKLAELFPDIIEVDEEKLHEAGLSNDEIYKLIDLTLGPRMIGMMKAYLTKEKLQDAGIKLEIIEKFDKLFPGGTEVTHRICIKHPDIFSFGNKFRVPLSGIEYDRGLELALLLCKGID